MATRKTLTDPACRTCEYLVRLTEPSSIEALDKVLIDAVLLLHPECQISIYKGSYSKTGASNSLSARSKSEQQQTYPYSAIVTVTNERDRTTIRSIVIHSHIALSNDPNLSLAIQVYKNQVHHINQASLDKLTGLLTRDLFEFYIQQIYMELRKVKRRETDTQKAFAVAFIDIDNFKKINDQYGHLMGDEVLLLISQLMKKTFRADDLLFRFGGEEFIVILRNCDTTTCRLVLERFRNKIEKHSFPLVEHITVSIGFTLIDHNYNYDVLIHRADKALYYAKENGKNSCWNYEELVDKNLIKPLIEMEGDVELF